MTDKYHTHAHFIEAKTGKVVSKIYIQHVPRVGEECRFSGDTYYKVVCVIHCYDEDEPHARVNIGLESIQ